MNDDSELIHERFVEQAQVTPGNIALVDDTRGWTYARLEGEVERVSSLLIENGCTRGSRIGIGIERSIDYVAAILGVMKIGGTCVPLDSSRPSVQIQGVIGESKTTHVLVDSAFSVDLTGLGVAQIGLGGGRASELALEPGEGATLDDEAYILFTSGSTGDPKGVVLSHRNYAHAVPSLAKRLNAQADDVFLHSASFAFSASFRQALVPLTSGAACFVARKDQLSSPRKLIDLIETHGVTFVDGVLSIWRQLLDYCEHDSNLENTVRTKLSKVRGIVTGGELVPIGVFQRLKSLFPNQARFFNLLGHSETVATCGFSVPTGYRPSHSKEQFLPVGTPYPDHEIAIVDERLSVVEQGEVGELCLRGPSVFCGYLNRPDLTADKMVMIELDGMTQSFLRTGDLVKELPDGTIELVGRLDFQVKIRGMRVEPDGVAAVIQNHPGVHAAAVVGSKNPSGDVCLIAYVVFNVRSEVPQEALRMFLSQRLPDYMIPSFFMFLSELPTNQNGKVDRSSLPPLAFPKALGRALESEVERALARIWSSVLNLQVESAECHFLELGGHSLAAAKISLGIEEDLGVKVPESSLFEHPVLHDLALAVEKRKIESGK